jgi:opacity protein-like surface antigen
MIKKCFLFLPVLLTATSGIKAQLYLGVEGGGNINFLHTNNSNQAFTVYSGRGGIRFGIPVQYKIFGWFSVEAAPSVVQKDYRISRTGFFQGIYQDNTNTYLELPVMGCFSFGGKHFRGLLNLGLYGAWWASGHVKGAELNILNPADSSSATSRGPTNVFSLNKPYDYSQNYSFDSRKDRRMEFGWLAGIGMTYEITHCCKVFLEGRYTQSLTDQQKDYMLGQVPRYNETISISTGVLCTGIHLFKRTRS